MAENNENTLIILKNSNPINKYPVDADQLNHNFEVLAKNQGGSAIKQLIESSGQVYTPVVDNQLAMAVAQYVFSATLFDEKGTTNAFKLYPKDGFSAPYRYTYGMVVSFVPTRTNTGPMTLQIGTNSAYPVYVGTNPVPSGFIVPNTLNSFRFMGTYWSQVSSSSTSAGGSGSGDSGSTNSSLLGVIQDVISSAGIAYDPTNTNQLSQAIATYISNSAYTATYAGNVYTLTPLGGQRELTSYTEGSIIHFLCPANNTAADPLIKIGDLPETPIVSYSGVSFQANELKTNAYIVLRYSDYKFRYISNYMPSLILGNNIQVTGISNDTTLQSNSSSNLVTEYAVKQYVDLNTKGNQYNTIVAGYTDNGSPAALNLVGDHIIQLKSRTETSAQVIKQITPNSAEDVISSSNTDTAVNCVSKAPNVYWETAKTGFLVDDVRRLVVSEGGVSYISEARTADGETIYLNTPAAPEWFGVKNITVLPDVVLVKFGDSIYAPQGIRFEVNTTPTLADTSWLPVISVTDLETSSYSYSYGAISNNVVDQDGYYTIQVPKYVLNGDEIQEFVPSGPFGFRMVITSFNNQFPSQETISAQGYDPNTDRTSTQYPMRVYDFVLGTTIDQVPEFIVTYPSGNTENIQGSMFFTQYMPSSDENTVALTQLTDSTYVIYKTLGIDTLYTTAQALVFYQTNAPEASEQTAGGLWFNMASIPYKTYTCVDVAGLSRESAYAWVEQDVILLGTISVTGNKITSVSNYSYGNSIIKELPAVREINNTISHNFGSNVTVAAELVCISANNGYAVNDVVSISPYMNTVYTPPENPEETGTTSTSYFSITNTKHTTTINTHNLQIINRNTHTFVNIPGSSWVLRVYIDKE